MTRRLAQCSLLPLLAVVLAACAESPRMATAVPCPDSQEVCDRAPLCTFDEGRECRQCLCTLPPRKVPNRMGPPADADPEAPGPPVTAPSRNVPLP